MPASALNLSGNSWVFATEDTEDTEENRIQPLFSGYLMTQVTQKTGLSASWTKLCDLCVLCG